MTREFRFRNRAEAEMWSRPRGVYGDEYWACNTSPAIRRELKRYSALGDAYPFREGSP